MNTRYTWVIQFMSSHLVCHTKRVVYRYSRYILTIKCISFAAEELLIVFFHWRNIYVCMSSLINLRKHTYNVETRVKSHSYVPTCSLNHISYSLRWTVIEVNSRQKYFTLMSITWKAYWSGVVLPNIATTISSCHEWIRSSIVQHKQSAALKSN